MLMYGRESKMHLHLLFCEDEDKLMYFHIFIFFSKRNVMWTRKPLHRNDLLLLLLPKTPFPFFRYSFSFYLNIINNSLTRALFFPKEDEQKFIFLQWILC